LKSEVLTSFAVQVADNPFNKVVEMIENLVAKMKEEAEAEAQHKAYCDEELRKNKISRDKLEAAETSLTAEIETTADKIERLQERIKVVTEEIAALRVSMTEATTERTEEKEKNLKSIKDAKAGQVAVKQAIVVLEEFYSSQGDALLQVVGHGKQVPEMKGYKGMQGENNGVVGMLEVIESDFSRLETDTSSAENQAAMEYETFMNDAQADLEAKNKAEFKLGLDLDQAEFEKEQFEKDLRATQEQLGAERAYYEELKPQCVEVNVNYKERAARRKDEIAALKEAYQILDQKS